MTKKHIFVDLDGTYIGHMGDEIPSAAIAVRKLLAKGHDVYLCTGRNISMADLVYHEEKTGQVLTMGAYIEVGGKAIYSKAMKKEDLEYLNTLFPHGDRTYSGIINAYSEGFNYQYFKEGPDKNNKFWLEMKDYQGEDVYKFSLHVSADEHQIIEDFIDKLDKEKYAYAEEPFMLDYGHSVEVTLKGISKGRAIKYLADNGYIDINNTIGIGDSMNDVEMMQTCAYSIAMGDGDERMRGYADMITDGVYDNGFYNAFVKLGLIGELND